MSFKDLKLRLKYRSSDDNIVTDFYVPVLKKATTYKRAVGYFSSTSLIQISKGISGLVNNNGKIKLIASPHLSEDDIKAINQGYKNREKIIKKNILNSFSEPNNYFEEERLNLLAHLITEDMLDIKLAFFEEKNKVGLYHEKIGVIYDKNGNKIAFTGSLNESLTAFRENFESIDVFYSWKSEESRERILDKEKDFDKLWKNETKKISVINFPEAAQEKLKSYMKDKVDWNIDKKEFNIQVKEKRGVYNIEKRFPKIPDDIELYNYQKKAIKSWSNNNYRGIFDMATGTGKTYTALGAASRLYSKKNKLAVIVVCPYQHLVDQWVEDVKKFNMEVIIGHSGSEQKNWKNKLKNTVLDYNLGLKNNFCLVTTNITFSNKFVQSQIEQIDENILLIGDEAHNLGAKNVSKSLKDKIEYRLALSATIIRHHDEKGTKKLLDYFGKVCIKYSLEKAINDGYLSQYYYYPIVVNLTNNELLEYRRLSKEIIKYIKNDSKGNSKLTEKGKWLAIKRARLVAGAVNKLDELKELVLNNNYQNKKHMLFYCGATTVEDIDYRYNSVKNEEIKQINAVTQILGNELNMRVAQFTSNEGAKERKLLKKEFKEGQGLQALVAIRCLDEGVDIPNIKTAFILASSTNPKEYIQRRGRVLRLSKNKDFAEIYDFVTLPRKLNTIKNFPIKELKKDKSLIKREISRVKDFADLSKNPQDGLRLVKKLKKLYNLKEV